VERGSKGICFFPSWFIVLRGGVFLFIGKKEKERLL